MNDNKNVDTGAASTAAVVHASVQKKCTLESLTAALESAPPPPKKITKMDVLAALKNQLAAAKKRGHDAQSLAAVLQAGGLKVSQRMVADLLREVQPKARLK
ncbi:hypothetical protein [Rhodoferax sp.]|uniref:hypothetical protein n=1 Tax=Rhodoferax sp. TaxID=50421 RepID=UPI0027559177|nr:hypothetical protein [Rhodoferax sp.]